MREGDFWGSDDEAMRFERIDFSFARAGRQHASWMDERRFFVVDDSAKRVRRCLATRMPQCRSFRSNRRNVGDLSAVNAVTARVTQPPSTTA